MDDKEFEARLKYVDDAVDAYIKERTRRKSTRNRNSVHTVSNDELIRAIDRLYFATNSIEYTINQNRKKKCDGYCNYGCGHGCYERN